jgi:ribosome biogenesis protein BRX1
LPHIAANKAQVVAPVDKKKPDPSAISLVECGPRLCLNPIRVFAGSFGGPTLYENSAFVSPNAIRSARKKAAAGRYKSKTGAEAKRREHVAANPVPRSELDGLFRGQ